MHKKMQTKASLNTIEYLKTQREKLSKSHMTNLPEFRMKRFDNVKTRLDPEVLKAAKSNRAKSRIVERINSGFPDM